MKNLSASRGHRSGRRTSSRSASDSFSDFPRSQRFGLWVIIAELVIWLVPITLNAQLSSTAGINGTVRDQSGAVIAGAQVILINTQTGVERTTVVGDTGRYLFVSILPGRYTLVVSKQGVTKATREPF